MSWGHIFHPLENQSQSPTFLQTPLRGRWSWGGELERGFFEVAC
jgi:hypothetical protein